MPTVQTDIDDRGVATLTIDNPPINLMTLEVFIELLSAVAQVAADDAVRAVVLRSANPEWFIAHFDVEALLGAAAGDDVGADPDEAGSQFHLMCETLRTMPKPTIALIEGRIGGGGSEVALSCDMRFATPQSVLSQPEVALGLIPGGSGTVRLPRLVGRSRALEVILGCDDIDAATAEQWGWINRVVAADEIVAFVDRLAGRIASFPTHAVAAAKASVIAAEVGVAEHLSAESSAFGGTLADGETQSLMRQFLDAGGQTPETERRIGSFAAEFRDA